MKKFLPPLMFFGIVLIFFWQLFIRGLLPIPSDTIVGLYYPFRDAYLKTNPNGLPYKNFLVTDPVRQQIPWKQLAISMEKIQQLPVWNPYTFAGTPLLANFQSGAFYPLNILFFILSFPDAWSLFIFFEPLLAGIFLYYYLDNLKLNKYASFLGALSFSFGGFFVAWLEWGNILNTALWLPLILLSIDKLVGSSRTKNHQSKILWSLVFLFSLVSSFFAGYLQAFFYLGLVAAVYFLARWFRTGKKLRTLGLFIALFVIFMILSLPQLIPGFRFIQLSARSLDLPGWSSNPGWFIPWQNLIQFLVPDFFGNPATLNYYGVWNYGEFIGYVGIIPLIFAIFGLFFRRDRKTLFFGCLFFISLIFSFPTIFAKIPFLFNLPFISTAQPTRLLYLIDFSLSILAAFGLDYFIIAKNKKPILYMIGVFCITFVLLWGFVLFSHGKIISTTDLRVARQNLILPSGIFILSAIAIISLLYAKTRFKKHSAKLLSTTIIFLILITVFDLLRFGLKFEPFTFAGYLFPNTSVTTFLQKQSGPFRVMSLDSRIFPPNFSAVYKIQTLDGYDPLYLKRYGELMAAIARNRPDFSPPLGFNRIITPQDYTSALINLLNVKYILSLNEINSNGLKEVFSDGVIRVYQNLSVYPRAFFVITTLVEPSEQHALNAMFANKNDLNKIAVVEDTADPKVSQKNWSLGQVKIDSYTENKVKLTTQTGGKAFLVLTDSFYPTWHATIDGKETKIYLTDLNFRGIIVPAGDHTIEFYVTLF